MKQKMMWIVWPSFLTAAILEMVVFAFVDPRDLHWLHGSGEINRLTGYTAGFFLFWTVTALCGTLTTLLSMSSLEVNHGCKPKSERPDSCNVQ